MHTLKKFIFKKSAVFLLALLALLSPFLVRATTANQIKTSPEPAQVILVFGAGLKDDGTPSDVLMDRLKVAAQLYEEGKAPDLILSGDNRFENYSEPDAMHDALVDLGVPEEALHEDFAGRRTYDTCVRAHQIWGVDSAILVTQEFHLPRALYTCKNVGIQSQGVSADLQPYVNARYFAFREWLATYKAVVDLHLVRPSVILGEPETLQ